MLTKIKNYFYPCPEVAYRKIMSRDYGIDIDKDFPTGRDVIEKLTEGYPKGISLEELEYLALQDKREGDFAIASFNHYWNTIFQLFKEHFTDENIYVGEVPFADFNAWHVETGGGYLLLFNRGIALLISRVSILMLGCMRLRSIDGDILLNNVFDIRYSQIELKKNINEMAHKTNHLWPARLNSEYHIGISSFSTHVMEIWVCAHELGHITANKSDLNSYETEYLADEHGYSLYQDTYPKLISSEGDNVPDILHHALHYIAPQLFFLISDSIETAVNCAVGSHPNAQERASKLRSYKNCYSKEAISHGDRLYDHLKGLLT